MNKIIQKIRCSVPFNFTYFGHKHIRRIRKLSDQSELIECIDCKRRFAINHGIGVILPWETVRHFYEEMAQLFGESDILIPLHSNGTFGSKQCECGKNAMTCECR